MKNIGIIAEYNPFHNGHLYQIKKIKEEFPNSTITVVMSPYFVQRGEPSILDKFERTNIILEHEVDLVIELPTIYSLQSAENFGYGGVSILNSLGYIDFLSFGVEAKNFEKIIEYVDVQLKYSKEIEEYTLIKLKEGLNFAKAKNESTKKIYKDLNIYYDDDIIKSNNILAIEYLKSLKILDSKLKCFPILRDMSDHADENINYNNITSATSIRKFVKNNSNLNKIKTVIPYDTFLSLEKENKFKNIDDYTEIFKYKLLIEKKSMENITGYEDGIENLLIKNFKNSLNLQEVIDKSINKRYSKTRLQRLIINYLLNIDNDIIDKSKKLKNDYIRVLGFNNRGKDLLKKVKKETSLDIITNFKQKDKLINSKLLDIELDASNLYYIKNKEYNIEYFKNPVVKK